MSLETEVVIIGAGLSGLTAAYALRKAGLTVKILESRDRYGGRIHTLGYENNTPVEMGATWLGVQHQTLIKLLKALDIDTFEQVIGDKAIYEAISTSPHYLATLPPNPEPSLRIKRGTYSLIDKLVTKIESENIFLNQRVQEVRKNDKSILVKTNTLEVHADKVIVTLPPNLLVNSIRFLPVLPSALVSLAEKTHTWMGESIKIALRYDRPFWRTDKLSGTIISNVGPIPEMYDHSNVEDSSYALMGFLNGSYHNLSKANRLSLILTQLRKYFGSHVDSYSEYCEEVWRNEADTFRPYKHHVLPHQNNGHAIFNDSYYDDRLILAGTETSKVFPGYMEGAVCSGLMAAQKITLSSL